MPCHTPRVYALVTDLPSGRVVGQLGPYATAAAARTACGVAVGEVLIWTRDAQDWVAELNGREYRVPAGPGLGA